MVRLKLKNDRESSNDSQPRSQLYHNPDSDLELRLCPLTDGLSMETNSGEVDVSSNLSADSLGYRFFFWDGKRWTDFSTYSNTLLEDALKNRKDNAVVPGAANCLYEVDFAHRIQRNIRTGYVQSIAWECRSIGVSVGFDCTPSERLELLQGHGQPSHGLKLEALAKERPEMLLELPKFESKAKELFSKLGESVQALEFGAIEFCAVRHLFEKGFTTTPRTARPRVTAVQKVGNSSAKSTYFGEQVIEMERSRGDANLKYAWYGASADEIASIVMYGFSIAVGNGNNGKYGYGTYLAPQTRIEFAASNTEEDRNKERHLLLCEVILGTGEVIHPGSTHRFLPSSANYDSGTDDLKNPSIYVVWSPFINSHIIPWYIVSFLTPPADDVACTAPPPPQKTATRPPKVLSRRLNALRASPYPTLRVPDRDASAVQKLFQPPAVSPSLSPAGQATWLSILANPTLPSPRTPSTPVQGVHALSLASPDTPPSTRSFTSQLVLASPTSVLIRAAAGQRGDSNGAQAAAPLSLMGPSSVDHLLSTHQQHPRDSASRGSAAAMNASQTTDRRDPEQALSSAASIRRPTTFCRRKDGTIQLGEDIYIAGKKSLPIQTTIPTPSMIACLDTLGASRGLDLNLSLV